MTSRFLAKVLYTAQSDNGAFQRKIEQLVFEALTYTDCEAAVYKYMESVTRAEFTIMKIDRFQVDKLIVSKEPNIYFLIKQEWDSVDGPPIKEKILIAAKFIEEAKTLLALDNSESIVGNLHLPTIKSIVETKITDYIYADPDEN